MKNSPAPLKQAKIDFYSSGGSASEFTFKQREARVKLMMMMMEIEADIIKLEQKMGISCEVAKVA